ncbi:hypothetical protein [Enterococcus hulanensis]|uniref:hypothetical protein n=1 Tax=Enterococcus hulanensis TaxID=2559929 RepID=UPI0010F4FD9E|nr:hypothetical protein [Enterococcus hulanensis]
MRKRDYRELQEKKIFRDRENKEYEEEDYSKDIFDSIRLGFSVGTLILLFKNFIETFSKDFSHQENLLYNFFFLGVVYLITRIEVIHYVEFGSFKKMKKTNKVGVKKWSIVLLIILILGFAAAVAYFGLDFIFKSWERICN